MCAQIKRYWNIWLKIGKANKLFNSYGSDILFLARKVCLLNTENEIFHFLYNGLLIVIVIMTQPLYSSWLLISSNFSFGLLTRYGFLLSVFCFVAFHFYKVSYRWKLRWQTYFDGGYAFWKIAEVICMTTYWACLGNIMVIMPFEQKNLLRHYIPWTKHLLHLCCAENYLKA